MSTYEQQEKEMLGAIMLRRDGWVCVGCHWVKPWHNAICATKTTRYAERPPMNRKRRRARRRGRDNVPAGHTIADRRSIAQCVRHAEKLGQLILFGTPEQAQLSGLLWA